ncbi:MAG: transglutaminase-like domain-containing protein [Pirellulaceae bacterium]
MDVSVVVSFANLGLVLAAAGRIQWFQNLAVMFASACIVVVMPMTKSTWSIWLAILFGVLVLWWSMGNYWQNLDVKIADRVSSNIVVRTKTMAYFVVLISLLCYLLFPFFNDSNIDSPSLSWFSGGDKYSSDYARDGIGDGNMVKAAVDDPKTFGPVDSDIFLESKRPSLFDVANEVYGKPRKPSGAHKAIALGQEKLRHNHGKLARSEVGGAEFSTARESKSAKATPGEDIRTAALFLVNGSMPSRFAVATYEIYDSGIWKTITPTEIAETRTLPGHKKNETVANDNIILKYSPVKAMSELGEFWMRVRSFSNSLLLASTEYSAIEVINFSSTAVPSLPCIEAVKIESVDREDFWGVNVDGIVHLTNNSDRIPDLTVVHTLARGISIYEANVNPDRVRNLLRSRRGKMERYLTGHGDSAIRDQLVQLGQEWTQNCQSDWSKVEAIVDRLRQDFVYTENASDMGESQDCIHCFLERQEGPDYMFASLAALMIRELEIPTRVVSGFLPDPKNFDSKTGVYPVFSNDLHMWTEVCLDGEAWIPIEPTPGFPMPKYRLTWLQRGHLFFSSMGEWSRRNWFWLVGIVALVFVGYIARGHIIHASKIGRWYIASSGELEQLVLVTADLIDFRVKHFGCPRPAGITQNRFLQDLCKELEWSEGDKVDIRRFGSVLNRVLYGGASNDWDLTSIANAKTACRKATEACRRSVFRNGRIRESEC